MDALPYCRQLTSRFPDCGCGSAQRWKLRSLIEGGAVAVPQFDGADPIVSTSDAPSLICAWRNQAFGKSTPSNVAD